MSGRSKISRLPKNLKLEIDKLIANGATVDEITAHLKDLGQDIGRSSVGRYSQKAQADVIAKITASLELSEAMGDGLSLDKQNKQHQHILSLLNVLMHNMAFDAVNNDASISPKDIAMLGRAVKDAILSASKLEDIKAVERKLALEKATEILNSQLSDKKAKIIIEQLEEAYGVK